MTKRHLYILLGVCIVLGILGSALLGYRLTGSWNRGMIEALKSCGYTIFGFAVGRVAGLVARMGKR